MDGAATLGRDERRVDEVDAAVLTLVAIIRAMAELLGLWAAWWAAAVDHGTGIRDIDIILAAWLPPPAAPPDWSGGGLCLDDKQFILEEDCNAFHADAKVSSSWARRRRTTATSPSWMVSPPSHDAESRRSDRFGAEDNPDGGGVGAPTPGRRDTMGGDATA